MISDNFNDHFTWTTTHCNIHIPRRRVIPIKPDNIDVARMHGKHVISWAQAASHLVSLGTVFLYFFVIVAHPPMFLIYICAPPLLSLIYFCIFHPSLTLLLTKNISTLIMYVLEHPYINFIYNMVLFLNIFYRYNALFTSRSKNIVNTCYYTQYVPWVW
jgi:hypothetical protein